MKRWKSLRFAAAAFAVAAVSARAGDFASLEDASTDAGFLVRLLVNETAFPGERGYVSEENSRDTMRSVLWVLHSRLSHVPAGYSRREIGAVDSTCLLDYVTARGQCEGFGCDSDGKRTIASRVEERVRYLLRIANSGKAPGRFARLLNYAQDLSRRYFAGDFSEKDLFEGIDSIGGVPVTGRAYSWMTGNDLYNPGGNFVKIPDSMHGLLGGNRFFTLKKKESRR